MEKENLEKKVEEFIEKNIKVKVKVEKATEVRVSKGQREKKLVVVKLENKEMRDQPNISNLKLYGSRVFVRVPEIKRHSKWDRKADIGILVGYENVGYRVLVKMKVMISIKENSGCNEIEESVVNENKKENKPSNNINENRNDQEIELRRSQRERKKPDRYGISDSYYIYVNIVSADSPKTYEESIQGNDSRLVVRGFQQSEVLEDLYSPVAKMDVETAFLNGKIKSEVFVKQPLGYNDKTEKVYKLEKALYGLRESPRAWYECFDGYIQKLGFKRSLTYKRNVNAEVMDCFVDADWAGDRSDRKSTTGFLIRLFGNVIYWKVRKQDSVTKSSTAAEYVALSEAVSDIIVVKDDLSNAHVELHHSQAPALLLTAVVHLLDRDGRPHECRVLLDSGSEAHFLTIRFANLLRIAKRDVNVPISGVNQTETRVKQAILATLKSRTENYALKLQFLLLPTVTNRLPSQRIPQEELTIPAGIQLADPKFYEPANIDAILGVEIFASLWRAGQSIRLNENLMAQGTVLGWLVMSTGATRTPQSVNCHTATVDLNSQLEKFWKIEEVAESSIRSHEENLCEAHYRSNTRRDDTGRYIVRLPFKEENQLRGSYTSALRRFHALERSLSRKPKIRDEYIKFLSEYEELGHMTRIEGGPHEDRFYLPHHAVLKHTSITTKLRVVFDASAKTSNGKSLNNVLMVGPTIQEDLFALLIRFRSRAIAITADIAKILNTVTYGTASVSFLATRTLHQLASDEFNRFPRAAIALKEDFYVDDLLTGARTVKEAKQVRDELISITAGAGMHLRQWASNCAEILKDLDTADNNIINLDSSGTIKTLGVNWNAAEDNISYTVKRAADPSKVTKRVILSEISQLFDPLGLLGPVVINAKMMMQRLWQLKSTWDEDVPADIYKIWQEFRQNLHTLEEIRFARNVAGDGEEMEMHGFCDASERAYGACIYVKTLGKNPTLRLVCAKSKVAPLKTQSLPRLELCGALILSRLFKATKNALRRNDFCRTIFWADSTVVLHWLNTPPHTLKTYVAHRVAEIQESTARELWRHVSSEHNPADLISRGVTPAELRESKLWKSGPVWLIQPESNWPHSRLEPIEIPEKKRIVTHAKVATPFELFRRYSSFVKLKRIIVYCVRFARNSRNLKEKKIMGELTVDELKGAEIIAIRLIQEEAFPEIIKLIKSGKEVCALFSVLSPFVDNLGILRVGGRLARSNLPYEQRHPALLPKDHTITNAIIHEKHHQIGHGGTQATLNALRESFWPINGRSSVKRVI
ncbi:uncharacterized protein LOC122525681 [Polistes fuscatus]|uniref:uncharacterized protein LOC122525681 n=1 Tax=Polistes fuscatus TaxID=30207 RepID=UPI001CA85FCF|nr:uncharacterized protein LOC122525681 [Polistes fuscatus]